jgi:protein phosphatase
VLTSGAATDTGRVRSINQDAYLDCPDLGLWAVADGMGGHSDGALASRTIVEGLRPPLPRGCRLGNGARLIRRRLTEVNRELRDRAAALEGEHLIGSTAVTLLAMDGHCALLWVGDSRAYRVRDGTLSLLTTDHSQVQAMVEAELLAPEQSEGHPLSNVLLRAVGGDDELEVDGRIDRLRAGDRWLLCSDGLYRELAPQSPGRHAGQGPTQRGRPGAGRASLRARRPGQRDGRGHRGPRTRGSRSPLTPTPGVSAGALVHPGHPKHPSPAQGCPLQRIHSVPDPGAAVQGQTPATATNPSPANTRGT